MALVEIDRTTQARTGKDTALRDWVRALEATAPISANPNRILPDVIAELAQSRGESEALISGHGTLTYRALAERANCYARWALGQELAKGETVCLMMPNRPEYLAVWLGITSVGGVVALLNTNLIGPSLAHCINVVAPKPLIVGPEVADPLTSALKDLAPSPTIWFHGWSPSAVRRLDLDLEQYS